MACFVGKVRHECRMVVHQLLNPHSKRFCHLGVSGLKNGASPRLAKTDPEQPGFVAFPSGLDNESFQELVSERRTPVKRHGFTVYPLDQGRSAGQ